MSKTIQALARGLKIVNVIDAADSPVSLKDLHETTGMDKATILRILATLENEGWVYRGIGDNRYRLTYKLHDLGMRLSVEDAIAQVSAPVLDRLQRELQWPSDISVYDGEGMAIIETSRRRSPFVVNREVLGYKPSILMSAMGRAYLAHCDARRLEMILELLKKCEGKEAELASNRRYIDAMLSDIRVKGYAERSPDITTLHSDEEVDLDAIAVPIMVMGDVQASLNVVWMKSAYADSGIKQKFYLHLKQAAEELSDIFQENGIY